MDNELIIKADTMREQIDGIERIICSCNNAIKVLEPDINCINLVGNRRPAIGLRQLKLDDGQKELIKQLLTSIIAARMHAAENELRELLPANHECEARREL